MRHNDAEVERSINLEKASKESRKNRIKDKRKRRFIL